MHKLDVRAGASTPASDSGWSNDCDVVGTPSSPSSASSRPAPTVFGTPDAYRQFIAEALAVAEIHARIGASYAEIGDDAGLDYAVRCLVAQTRAAFTILADLKEMKAQQRRRAEAQSAAQSPRGQP